MKSYRKMTRDEHVALGKKLYDITQEMTNVLMSLEVGFTVTSSQRQRVHKMSRELSKLRSEMDEQLVRDYPDGFCPWVYYPGNQQDFDEHMTSCKVCGGRQAG